MNVIQRGIRNAFRNGIRSVSIIVILGLSVGLALSMLIARQAVEAKIESVKSSIGNTITISPAGTRGFEGGGEPLTDSQMDQVSALDHVTGVVSVLSDQLTSESSSLESAIDAGSLGERRAGNMGFRMKTMTPDGEVTESFTPPVIVTGTSDPSSSVSFSGSAANLTAGELFDAGSGENVAVIGKSLAEKNSLQVGSTFEAYGEKITVAGIYDAGNQFANNGVVMPLAALQKLSDRENDITSATATVDSIDNMDAVVSNVESTLGESADVVSQKETAEAAVEPLENIKSVTLFSLVSAVIAGATIILLTMVMIVRERRREIGVLKAIGASNVRVMTQFMTESVTLTTLGAIMGVIIGILVANPLTQLLVTSNSDGGTKTNGPGRVMMGGPGPMLSPGQGINLEGINATIGWDILGYGLVVALLIAIAGSAAAAWLIAKVRPAEVMRAE